MSKCLNCGKQTELNQRTGKPRKYCSRVCNQKYLTEQERKKHPNYDDPNWKNKTTLQKKLKKEREMQFLKCQQTMLTTKQIADKYEMTPANVWYKAQALQIKPLTVMWGGKKDFYTEAQAERIAIEDYHDKENNFLKKKRKAAKERMKLNNQLPEVKKRNNARNNARRKERLKSDPAFKLRRNVSTAIYQGLKINNVRKDNSTWSKLSYTPQELKEHLESKWTKEMSWENYGTYWQIDHIQPQASLPYTSLDEKNFQKCWELKNLQPLESTRNASKSSWWQGKMWKYKG
jgi:hypothetical protein